jgi:hypothetical protein
MVLDRNPSFGRDSQYEMNARSVANMLWQATNGNLSLAPQSYLDSLAYQFSDGAESLLSQLNKVDFSEDCSQEEFQAVVEQLIKVNPEDWPEPEYIESIPSGKLLYEIEPEPFEFSESDWDFSTGNVSDKVELFLKKTIASVYTDGVTSVTDKDGNPPNAQNNYLMAADGNSFSGVFHDSPSGGDVDKHFPFVIRSNKKGTWEIQY